MDIEEDKLKYHTNRMDKEVELLYGNARSMDAEEEKLEGHTNRMNTEEEQSHGNTHSMNTAVKRELIV